MLVGSCIWGTIGKYEPGTPKVARNAFNIGVAWNPVCCHGNKTVTLKLWSTFSCILLERIKHFWYKLAEISFFTIFVSVECMTSPLDYEIPVVAYRRSPNLRDLLVRAKLWNSATATQLNHSFSTFRCNCKHGCLTCPHIDNERTNYTFSNTGEVREIKLQMTYNLRTWFIW